MPQTSNPKDTTAAPYTPLQAHRSGLVDAAKASPSRAVTRRLRHVERTHAHYNKLTALADLLVTHPSESYTSPAALLQWRCQSCSQLEQQCASLEASLARAYARLEKALTK